MRLWVNLYDELRLYFLSSCSFLEVREAGLFWEMGLIEIEMGEMES